MTMKELPFGQPGRLFRSPMPFGKHDPKGLVYAAYRDHDISVIVLLAEDHECQEKARRDLNALYTQDGFTVVHLPMWILAFRDHTCSAEPSTPPSANHSRVATLLRGHWKERDLRSIPHALERPEQRQFVAEFTG